MYIIQNTSTLGSDYTYHVKYLFDEHINTVIEDDCKEGAISTSLPQLTPRSDDGGQSDPQMALEKNLVHQHQVANGRLNRYWVLNFNSLCSYCSQRLCME